MIAWIVFAGCAAFVVYVVAVYPRLLDWMASRPVNPVAKRRIQPKVSIVIAAYNSARFVENKLRSVLALNYPREKLEVLVVSDGSTDETADLVRRFAAEGVRLLEVPRGGKPAALNAGIPAVSGEILVLTDVRQELEPDGLQQMVDNFADPRVGVVSGDLLIRDAGSADQRDVARYWDYERRIRVSLGKIDSMFGATGPYYAIRRELAVHVPPDTLLDDVYLPLSAFFRGYRLIVEQQARAYDYPTSLGTEFTRKVRTLAGNYQILKSYPALLGPGNRLWFHFVSYKFGRLMLPWALLGMAVSSLFLPGWLGRAALLGQLLFYSLALADRWIGPGALLKKLTSPCRTFVTLILAAVFALKVFFVEPRQLWKVTSAGKMT